MDGARASLREALEEKRSITFGVSELRPGVILEMLADAGGSYRMSVESLDASVTVEVGNGLVVGAEAVCSGRRYAGPDAYAMLQGTRTGSAHVEPLRFPSLANILEPIAELPALLSPSSAPPPPGADTELVMLPRARPVHVPDPTEEIDLPPSLLAPRSAPKSQPPPPPRSIDDDRSAHRESSEMGGAGGAPAKGRGEAPNPIERAPARVAAIAPPRLEVPVEIAPARASRWRTSAVAVGVLALFGVGVVSAASFAGASEEAEPEVAIARPAPAPTTVTVRPVVEEEDVEAEEDDASAPNRDARLRARALARQARRLLDDGRAREALPRARTAARLRHLPYYQVLLGDALRANGQRDRAERAYRRALRMRPGYRPALRRLERRGALAARSTASRQT